MAGATLGPQVTVVAGVDGAGRTHRLREIAAAATIPVVHVRPPVPSTEALAGMLADAADRDCLVVVDDAHRLGPDELHLLTESAGEGTPQPRAGAADWPPRAASRC